MGWSSENLTSKSSAPVAFAAPAAYVFATQGNRHLIYLESNGSGGTTGNIIELYAGSDDVWHPQNLMSKAGGAPAATQPPEAFAFDTEQSQHVLYQADDSHIHELYWSDGDWNYNDLTTSASAPEAEGQAFGWQYAFWGRQQVVYQGLDGLVHLLTRDGTGSPQWLHQALTKPGDPVCSGEPGGYAWEAGRTQFVNYRGVDKRLYEISTDDTGKWGSPVDIGEGLAGVPDVISDRPVGLADEGAGTRHLDFLGADYNIWEYSFVSNWELTDLTGSVPAAATANAGYRPTGYMFPTSLAVPASTQHVIYIGADAVQELWRYSGSTWNENALGGPVRYPLEVSPSAFLDPSTNTQNVFYADPSGNIIQIRWEVGATFVGLQLSTHALGSKV
jgi:hypothetical protein